MMNKSLFHFFIFILCLFLRIPEVLANEEARERAFYALSSLRYYFEEKDSDSSKRDWIAFDEEDVTALWDAASTEPSIQDELETIRSDCYRALANNEIEPFRISQQQLKALWVRLQKEVLWDADHSSNGELSTRYSYAYPNVDGNPYIDREMRKKMKPYWFPLNHPLKPSLDLIFSQSRAIENELAFAHAGFVTLYAQPTSYIRVAKHHLLPGYLVKVYLDNEMRKKEGIPGWQWLVKRCKGAENIRNLIKKKKLKHFSVPDKWIYPLPPHPSPVLSPGRSQQPVLLVVTDMNLASEEETRDVWKNKITTKHLDELFCILSHGYSSGFVVNNIPYTKSGKFACIDTEHPKRKLKYEQVKPYLSEAMQVYWDELVRSGGRI
jgi:hypothetical protein